MLHQTTQPRTQARLSSRLSPIPARRLFPLHLMPIDRWFLLEDRPDYPMTYASNLYFSGRIDRTAFEDAVLDACDRHPLFRALTGPGKGGKLCWIDAGDNTVRIDWGPYDRPVAPERGEIIDLTCEPGVRFFVRADENRCRIVAQFHHACSDGTGAHRFLGDLLAAYGQRTTGGDDEPPRMIELDPQLVKQRRFKLASAANMRSFFRGLFVSLQQAARIFGSRIAPLAIPKEDHDEIAAEDAYPGVVSHTFNRREHDALRQLANRKGVMLNDLMVAEVFSALDEFNTRHGHQGKRLRIMMPNDLRQESDYIMPAANMTSYNFITRTRKQCRDPEALLMGIRDETLKIKHEMPARSFIEALMAADKVPGLLRRLASLRRCRATVTVSNMGDPTRRFAATFPRKKGKLVCGNLVLEKMVGVSPLRPMTRASVAFVTFYRELMINVRCDPHCMRVTHAREFLQTIVERLRIRLAEAAAM